MILDGRGLDREPRNLLAGGLEHHAIGVELGAELRRRSARRVDRLEPGAQLLELVAAGFEPRLPGLHFAGGRFHARKTFRQSGDLGAPE